METAIKNSFREKEFLKFRCNICKIFMKKLILVKLQAHILKDCRSLFRIFKIMNSITYFFKGLYRNFKQFPILNIFRAPFSDNFCNFQEIFSVTQLSFTCLNLIQ